MPTNNMEAGTAPDQPSAAISAITDAGVTEAIDACGDLQLRIGRDGTWYYRGSPIRRLALVKLFATVLRRGEDGGYWLVTPVERGRVAVDDVPFTVVELAASGAGRAQSLRLRTNLDEWVVVGGEHPLSVRPQPGGDGAPYVRVRPGLDARLERAVYYQLVELGEPGEGDAFGVWSGGEFFALGRVDD